MAKISFVHTGLPKNCISPNFLLEKGLEDYPGMAGTGFIARRANKLYYITARHCLTKNNHADVGLLASKLYIPIRLEGRTKKSSDYLQFECAISLKHNSDELPGGLIDLLALPIENPVKEKDRKHLLSRAVKLPLTGQWLDVFFSLPLVQEVMSDGKGPKFLIIGYPKEGASSEMSYPEKMDEMLDIKIQAASFYGYLAEGVYPDRFKLVEITWEHDLNGFSGSPVFAVFKNENGTQYGLAGMVVTGGNGVTQFIKIGVIAQAIERI